MNFARFEFSFSVRPRRARIYKYEGQRNNTSATKAEVLLRLFGTTEVVP